MILAASTVTVILLSIISGAFFGALTASGGFISYLILSLLFSQFTGRPLQRAAKLTLFLVVGVLFLGVGGIFGPLVLGIYTVAGVANDPSASSARKIPFLLTYILTILYYLVIATSLISKKSKDTSSDDKSDA